MENWFFAGQTLVPYGQHSALFSSEGWTQTESASKY
jgi:hypothetical protein